MSSTSPLVSHPRQIKSFALRQGRKTRAQQEAMQQFWPQFGIDPRTQTFADCFSPEAHLVLEIGFGMGDTLLAMAAAEPQNTFIGIEVHSPGVGRLLHLVGCHQIQNIRVIQADAVEVLRDFFPDASLERVQLFFPDPWPKKRHFKRRIVQPEFVQLIAKKLKASGLFHLATDWQPYAEHMLTTLSQNSELTNIAGKGQFTDRGDRPMTKFEQRGCDLGHAIFDLKFRKQA